jgi:hypothetical protein
MSVRDESDIERLSRVVYDRLAVFDSADLAELPPSARTAIRNALERVDRTTGVCVNEGPSSSVG